MQKKKMKPCTNRKWCSWHYVGAPVGEPIRVSERDCAERRDALPRTSRLAARCVQVAGRGMIARRGQLCPVAYKTHVALQVASIQRRPLVA